VWVLCKGTYVKAFLFGGGFVEGDFCGVAEALSAHFDGPFGSIEIRNIADRYQRTRVESRARRVSSNRGTSGI
jgi:hypothetical protein